MNTIIHVGNKDSAPANNLTDQEFDLILQALPLLSFPFPHLHEAADALHTKLLFNRHNFVHPNTAVTHADNLGMVKEYAVISPD